MQGHRFKQAEILKKKRIDHEVPASRF